MNDNEVIVAIIRTHLHAYSDDEVYTSNGGTRIWLYRSAKSEGYRYHAFNNGDLVIRKNKFDGHNVSWDSICTSDDSEVIFRCSISDPKFLDRLVPFLDDLRIKESWPYYDNGRRRWSPDWRR